MLTGISGQEIISQNTVGENQHPVGVFSCKLLTLTGGMNNNFPLFLRLMCNLTTGRGIKYPWTINAMSS